MCGAGGYTARSPDFSSSNALSKTRLRSSEPSLDREYRCLHGGGRQADQEYLGGSEHLGAPTGRCLGRRAQRRRRQRGGSHFRPRFQPISVAASKRERRQQHNRDYPFAQLISPSGDWLRLCESLRPEADTGLTQGSPWAALRPL